MPIQGSSADVTKLALARLHEALPDSAQLIHAVHDEILVECPADSAPAVAELVRSEMSEAFAALCPFVPAAGEVEIGLHWSHA